MTPEQAADLAARTCSVEGCDRPHLARGYCNGHWKRWRKTGAAATGPLGGASVEERFRANIDSEERDDCWLWKSTLTSGGYPRMRVNGRNTPMHRWAWEWVNGPVPDGMQLDHLCRVRSCCNPRHLEPVTPQENTLRGEGPSAVNATKDACPQGHAYTDDNTYRDKQGRRSCLVCRKEASRRHYERTRK